MDHVYLTMLYALTQYAADKLEIGQETVQAMVVSALGFRCFDQLKKGDFERVAEYVVGLLDDHVSVH
jgi:hypothetical protein